MRFTYQWTHDGEAEGGEYDPSRRIDGGICCECGQPFGLEDVQHVLLYDDGWIAGLCWLCFSRAKTDGRLELGS